MRRRRRVAAPLAGVVGVASESLARRVCVIAVALVLVLGCTVGCASLRGARLYRSGSQALERGELTLAVAQLEEAARLVPQASEIQNHLGLSYLALGRREAARGAFDRALQLDCDNQAARDNRLLAEGQALQSLP